MSERLYAYQPSFRNSIFFPLKWSEFTGREPVLIAREEIISIRPQFLKLSLILNRGGFRSEIQLNKSDELARSILKENPEKVLDSSMAWPPALLRNTAAAFLAFLFVYVIYRILGEWSFSLQTDRFLSEVCAVDCAWKMRAAIGATVSAVVLHPLLFAVFGVGFDEAFQRLFKDHSGRHVMKVGCGLLVFFTLAGSPVTPKNSAGRLVVGLFSSMRSLNAQKTPDFTYLPETLLGERQPSSKSN